MPLSAGLRYRQDGKEHDVLVFRSANGTTLSSGDEYQVKVHLPSAGPLAVYQISANGRIARLFPNSSDNSEAAASAGPGELVLPGTSEWYRPDNTLGIKTIYVVFSTGRMEDLGRLYAEYRLGDTVAGRRLAVLLAELAAAEVVFEQVAAERR